MFKSGSLEHQQKRLDAAAYWQSQCNTLETEKQTLRDHIVALEKANEICTEKLQSLETTRSETKTTAWPQPTPSSSTSKRNRAGNADENELRPTKKAKTVSSIPVAEGGLAQRSIEEEFCGPDLATNGSFHYGNV